MSTQLIKSPKRGFRAPPSSVVAAIAAFAVVAIAGCGPGPTNSTAFGPPSGTGSVAQIAPGRAGQLVAQHFGRPYSTPAHFTPAKKGNVGCIYLSDNSTGAVSIYDSGSLAQTGSISGGGWGVGDTNKNAFIATPSDTINVYNQCATNGKIVGTLTGSGGGSPYGMWAAKDGSLIATDWPNNLLDEWGPGPGGSEPYLGNSADANMGLPYFVFYDALEAAQKGEKERILVNGWNINGTHAQTDTCTRTLPNPALTCVTLIVNSGKFPGGVVGYHDISGKYQGPTVPNVIVNDQNGIMRAYACDIANVTCTLAGSFNYASPGHALYTAIFLDSTCKTAVWGAYISQQGSVITGDAQSNTPLPVGFGMALGPATAPIANAVTVGIAVSKPCNDT